MRWDSVHLDQIAEISSGQGAPQGAENFCDNGIPFIRAGSLEQLVNGVEETNCEHISDVIAKKHGLRLFPADTILFAKSGMSATLGRVYRLKSPAYVVSHLAAIIALRHLVDSAYLQRWFEKNPPSHLIPNEAYPSIRLSDIASLLVPLPPLPEQRRIAAILDKADAIRRKRQRAIERMEDFLRSVFLDMFGDPVTNPKWWKICKLHELCGEIVDCPHSTPQYSTTETSYFCVRSSDIQNSYLDWSTTKCVDASEYAKRIFRTAPKEEDVIYCREGARFGNAARIIDNKKICLGLRCTPLSRPFAG